LEHLREYTAHLSGRNVLIQKMLQGRQIWDQARILGRIRKWGTLAHVFRSLVLLK
jgi:hypothetical protein